MFRSSWLSFVRAGFALLLAAAAAGAAPRIEVGGRLQPESDGLGIRVELSNLGDTPTGPLHLQGELLGHSDEAQLDPGIAPGETRALLLRFPPEVPRTGVHPLLLHLEYSVAASAVSQRAFLLLALGTTQPPPPPVTLVVPEASVDVAGELRVRLESADGRPHRVRVRVATPLGLRDDGPRSVDVAASGPVVATLSLLRTGAPRGTTQGIVVVAEEEGDGPARAAAVTGLVRVLEHPGWTTRLRWPLLAAAGALVAAAAVLEALRFWKPPA